MDWSTKVSAFFIENRGVHHDWVKFYVEHGEGIVLFGEDRIVLRSNDVRGRDVRITFVEARKEVAVRGAEPRPTVVSYFQGPEPEWKRGLRTFGTIVYASLWPGIDLVFRGERGVLKYEFFVGPGVDPSLIRLRYEGAEDIEIASDGALCVRTASGTLRDPKPVAWQTIDGIRRPVEVGFRVRSAAQRLVGFEPGSFDPRYELVIDPAFLAYCGYAGPTRNILANVTVDGSGNAYLLGLDYAEGCHDGIRVMKVSSDGSRLEYVAFINGASQDSAKGIAVDAKGSVYVAGTTTSDENSFPVKVGPRLKHITWMNIRNEGFVLKLDPSGTNIVYCGYLGGSNHDGASSVAVDTSGSAWVIGTTASMDMPVKGGPLLKKPVPSSSEVLVAKVKPDGSGLLLSGYLGGNWDDYGSDVALDSRGDVYICGLTSSPAMFPVKVGPDLTYAAGPNGFDGFVAKIDGQTGQIQYCGFVGGAGDDYAVAIAVDGAGCAYVAGWTTSDTNSFPPKIGPYLKGTPGFLAKVEASGRDFVYCGRIPDGGCADVAIDGAGNAYIAGASSGNTSNPLPVQNGPSSTFGGSADAFVARVPPNGLGFVWGGYIGGVSADQANAIALDAIGNVYVVGFTGSNEQSFPLKVGPGLQYNGGDPGRGQWGAFVAKVAQTELTPSGTPRIGNAITLLLRATDGAGIPYQVGTSLGTGPIPIDNRQLGLSPDDLLVVSANGYWPAIFPGYRGVIDSKGQAMAAINIPYIPALIGVRLHSAFVTLGPSEPSGIRSISNTTTFTIEK